MKTPILSPWQSGNLFAPAWQGVTPLLKGWCDVDFDFTPIQVAVAPGSFALKNQLPVDTDADYLSREIFVAPIAGTTGDPITGIVNPSDLKIRITDGDGNAITSDWITANDLNGPVGPVPLPLRKGSIPLIDFWNQGTGTLIVQCGVKGFKRFKCSNEQGVIPPFYPASLRYCKPWRGVRFEDYEYPFAFSNGTSPFYPPWVTNLQPSSPNSVFQKFPLPIDNDADFLWRGLTGMIMTQGPSPVAQLPNEFMLLFYDNEQVPLARAVPRFGFTPAIAGPPAELVLSNGGGRMAPFFSEIFIPRGSNVYCDVVLQTNPGEVAMFSLRGVKVYDEGACNS